MRIAKLFVVVSLAACGSAGSGASGRGSEAPRREIQVNDVIAHMVIENTGPNSRRHNISIRAGQRTVATELHKFVAPETPGPKAAGIKCWALTDPQEEGYRIRTLCRGEAEVRPGEPGGLVAEGFIYCPPTIGKPSQLELRVSEQSVGEMDPDDQYLPVIRASCHD